MKLKLQNLTARYVPIMVAFIFEIRNEANADSKVAEKFYDSGIKYSKSGLYKRSILYFDKSIKLQPDYPEAYNAKGVALSYQGNFKEAKENYIKAIELKSDFEQAKNNLAQTKKAHDLQMNIQTRPKIFVKFQLNFFPETIKELYKDITFAAILHSSGYDEEAILYYQKEIDKNPSFLGSYVPLGEIQYNLGLFEESIETYEKMLKLGEYEEVYYNLSQSQYKLALTEEAKESFAKAKKLEDDRLVFMESMLLEDCQDTDNNRIDQTENSAILTGDHNEI